MTRKFEDFFKELHSRGDLLVGKSVLTVSQRNFRSCDIGRGMEIDILILDLSEKDLDTFFLSMAWDSIYPNLRTGFKVVITKTYK